MSLLHPTPVAGGSDGFESCECGSEHPSKQNTLPERSFPGDVRLIEVKPLRYEWLSGRLQLGASQAILPYLPAELSVLICPLRRLRRAQSDPEKTIVGFVRLASDLGGRVEDAYHLVTPYEDPHHALSSNEADAILADAFRRKILQSSFMSDLAALVTDDDGRPCGFLTAAARVPTFKERTHDVWKILDALSYMIDCIHSRRFVHNGISPHAVMALRSPILGATSSVYYVLADTSTLVSCEGEATPVPRRDLDTESPYEAPESRNGICSFASDVYAFGVCAIELLTGRRPDSSNPCAALTGGRDWSREPKWLIPLLTACVARDPTQRPSAHLLMLRFHRRIEFGG